MIEHAQLFQDLMRSRLFVCPLLHPQDEWDKRLCEFLPLLRYRVLDAGWYLIVRRPLEYPVLLELPEPRGEGFGAYVAEEAAELVEPHRLRPRCEVAEYVEGTPATEELYHGASRAETYLQGVAFHLYTNFIVLHFPV